ncbi:MAG: hypothetical protein P4N59_03415 [Negativicutes bacterium]|nr:hypothetical protein [Negativicutes bacterium]
MHALWLKLGQILGRTPTSGDLALWADILDKNVKTIDDTGTVDVLNESGLRSRNIIDNNMFALARRQVAATLTSYTASSARVLTADRWGLTNQTASTQFANVDTAAAPVTGLSARYYGQYKQITGAGKIMVSQAQEATAIAHTRGTVVRVQAKMWGTGTNLAYRLGLIQLNSSGTVDTIPGAQGAGTFVSAWGAAGVDPTLGANLAYVPPLSRGIPTTPLGGGAYNAVNTNAIDCVVTSTPTIFGALFVVPSNCLNLIPAIWSNGQLAVNDTINISEVGLYDGEEIRSFFYLDPALEMERLQRFYFKTFPIATAPAQNAGMNGAYNFQAGKAAATSQWVAFDFPVSMYKVPTLTLFNPSAANGQVRDVTGSVDCSATSTANASEAYCTITCTGNASTAVGDQLAVHLTGDAEI